MNTIGSVVKIILRLKVQYLTDSTVKMLFNFLATVQIQVCVQFMLYNKILKVFSSNVNHRRYFIHKSKTATLKTH